ncbi:MAG TPA: hypothetical protein VGK99_14300 [Acidobacteriota bacterium]
MPARFMALSLGDEGVTHLPGGQWQTTVAYRFLHGEDGYIGDRFDPNYASTIGAVIDIHSLDIQTTYAFNKRSSMTLTLPLVHGRISSFRDHENDGIHRHTMRGRGVGDARLLANAWLLDPGKHPDGNVSVSLGFKAPTGRSSARDRAYRPTGPVVIPVDIAIQPGDGGWGMVVESVAYGKVLPRALVYAAGFYMFNPREKNGAVTTIPVYGQYRPLSVPDQYQARVGLNYALAPQKRLSVSLGGRIDGIPSRDVFAGNDGFRRPGMAVYIEPGVSFARGANVYNVFVPVATYRNRTRNVYDVRFGGHGPGAFANFLIIASVTRRF